MRRMEKAMLEVWTAADKNGERLFPARISLQGSAAAANTEEVLPDRPERFLDAGRRRKKSADRSCPAGRIPRSATCTPPHVIRGDVKNVHTVRTGIEYMTWLARLVHRNHARKAPLGMFQIGGGIAGDFPICVVPMLHQDLQRTNVPLWGYFCQISDSTTSYGSYSGAVPNEKITWGKLGVDTPKFIIESDATIVAPLIFAYILGW